MGIPLAGAALVAVIEYLHIDDPGAFELVATVFTVIIGSVSFSGSIVTFLKLQELVATRPVVLPGAQIFTPGLALAAIGLAIWLMAGGPDWRVGPRSRACLV